MHKNILKTGAARFASQTTRQRMNFKCIFHVSGDIYFVLNEQALAASERYTR